MKNSSLFEVGYLVIYLPVIVIGMIMISWAIYSSGVFDNEEQKTIESIEQEQRKILNEQRKKFSDEVRYNIENNKLTCDYIGKIRIGYEKGENGLLSYTYFEDNLRIYWNVNSCGDEWNWWD